MQDRFLFVWWLLLIISLGTGGYCSSPCDCSEALFENKMLIASRGLAAIIHDLQ